MSLISRTFSKVVKLYLMLIFCCIAGRCFGQQDRARSKAEMYADFDTLRAKLQAISPHLPVKRDLWHYDALAQIDRLRKQVDTIKGQASFALLINKVLTSCQDYHTGVTELPSVLQKANDDRRVYLPLTYLDGAYVLTRSFRVANDTVPAGSIVVRIDGQKADNFVAGLTDKLVMRYDLARKKFYAEDFWQNDQSMLSGRIGLRFKTPANHSIDVSLPFNKRLDFIRPNRDTNRNQVTYWAERSVLYIRIYRMDSKLIPAFQKKIAAFRSSHQPLEKIIIDLRDNAGGNDEVWQSVYSAILPQPFRYPLTLDGYDPHQLPPAYLKDEEIDPDSSKQENSPVLKKYGFYHYVNKVVEIAPTDSSLRFHGKIVVIGNEDNYSAGASAFVVPNLIRGDNWYSVGRSTGRFLGVGYSPVVLKLPYSGISYHIEPAIETTGAKTLQELMHDKFEFNIPCTLQEITDRDQFDGNTQGRYYLEHFDPLIKKALEL